MKHSDTIDRVGIDEVQEANKDGTSSRLGEDVGHHISTFNMAEDENTFGDEIAQKGASTHNVLSFLESNRIKGHIDGGLGWSQSRPGTHQMEQRQDRPEGHE